MHRTSMALAALPSFNDGLPAIDVPQGLLSKHRVIVGVQDAETAAAKAQSHGLGVVKKLGFINAIVVEAPGLDSHSAAAAAETLLRAAGVNVRYVEPDAEVKALGLGDSPDMHWDIRMKGRPWCGTPTTLQLAAGAGRRSPGRRA